MAKAPARAAEAPEADEDEAPEALNGATDRLVRLIEARIGELERGDFSDDPTADLGKLSRALTPLVAEQRAKAKAERRALLALTLPRILTWVSEQTPEVRAKVRRHIEQLDAPTRRSVLA